MTPPSSFQRRQYVIGRQRHFELDACRSAWVLQMAMVAMNSKAREQSLNVFENKGPVWKPFGLSQYVYENTRT
jgi:hypothetical protein